MKKNSNEILKKVEEIENEEFVKRIVIEIVEDDIQNYKERNILKDIVNNYLNEEEREEKIRKYYENPTMANFNKAYSKKKDYSKVENLTEEEMKEILIQRYLKCSPYIGYCHAYWGKKKCILNKEFNIIWYTPAEENPDILYD